MTEFLEVMAAMGWYLEICRDFTYPDVRYRVSAYKLSPVSQNEKLEVHLESNSAHLANAIHEVYSAVMEKEKLWKTA